MSIKGIEIPTKDIVAWGLRVFTAVAVALASIIGNGVWAEIKSSRTEIGQLQQTLAGDHERYATKDQLRDAERHVAEQITSQITTANTRLANAEDRLITQEAAIRDMPRRIIEALKN